MIDEEDLPESLDIIVVDVLGSPVIFAGENCEVSEPTDGWFTLTKAYRIGAYDDAAGLDSHAVWNSYISLANKEQEANIVLKEIDTLFIYGNVPQPDLRIMGAFGVPPEDP